MNKIKITITGQAGFVGTHLYNFLKLDDQFEVIDFKDTYFQDQSKLEEIVNQCDAIVHLAAMNRHDDDQVLFDTNVKLVEQVIKACETTNSSPHILFSSSTQEERDNPYGRSKFKGRELLETWAKENGAAFTGLIIPNVFGAFGVPNYNSVVATFCHKLTHNEVPEIHVDGTLDLIYVHKLVEEMIQKVKEKTVRDLSATLRSGRDDTKRHSDHSEVKRNEVEESVEVTKHIERYTVPYQYKAKVTEILSILKGFKEEYLEKGVFPDLSDPFEKDLFNTYRTYIDEDHYPFYYTKHTDNRGSFVEIARTNSSGQFSYSTTVPGITRGNHYHTRKAERFAVIKGKATIQLRRIGTDKVINYKLDGENPSFVDMPIWTTHNIINTGEEELLTLFWINEPYDAEDPDTYFEVV